MKKSKINLDILSKDLTCIVKNYSAEDAVNEIRNQIWSQKHTLGDEDDIYLKSLAGEIFGTTGLILESLTGSKPVRDCYTEDQRLLMMFVLGVLTQQANIITPFIEGLTQIKHREYQTSEGGKATADIKKSEKHRLQNKIKCIWNDLKQMPERNRSQVIATRLDCDVRTVRRHIKELKLKSK